MVSFPTAFLLNLGGGITSNVTPDGMDRGAPPILESVLGDVLNCLGEARGCRPGKRKGDRLDGFSNALSEHCRQRHLVVSNMVLQLMEYLTSVLRSDRSPNLCYVSKIHVTQISSDIFHTAFSTAFTYTSP
jgi:hypothetical protein